MFARFIEGLQVSVLVSGDADEGPLKSVCAEWPRLGFRKYPIDPALILRECVWDGLREMSGFANLPSGRRALPRLGERPGERDPLPREFLQSSGGCVGCG